MMNLQKFLEIVVLKGFGSYLSASNMDDVFRTLKEIGVTEIEVSTHQMSLITLWETTNSKSDWKKEIQSGEVDKFWGIKLKLKN